MRGLSSSFEEAWARFQSLDSLRLIQDTLEWEWARGRSDYLAFLVPIEQPQAREHIRGLLEPLRTIPGIEAYPESYWHITVKGVGFQAERPQRPDEISAGDIERIAPAAGQAMASQEAFEVSLGLVNAFESVVFVEVLDEGQRLAALNARLQDEVPALPRYAVDTPHFLPHISIARFASSEGLERLRAELAALRIGPPGPVMRVGKVQLVRARLAAAPATLEMVASYPLEGAGR